MNNQGKAEEQVNKKAPSSTSSKIGPLGSAVPADSPLARAREAAKRKAEDAERKNAAAAVGVKSIYEDKENELRVELTRQAAAAEAVRRNQEMIRQQMEDEKNKEQALQPSYVENASHPWFSYYCWDSREICMRTWESKKEIIADNYRRHGLIGWGAPCNYYAAGNLACWEGPNRLDFNK